MVFVKKRGRNIMRPRIFMINVGALRNNVGALRNNVGALRNNVGALRATPLHKIFKSLNL